MPNWSKAQSQYKSIVSKNGLWIQWLKRTSTGSSAYDTGSSTTFGYGDEIVFWTTGSVKAVVEQSRADEVLIEQGYSISDYNRIFVDPSETLEFWDQCIYPSGSGIRYIIMPLHNWRMTVGDTVVGKYATIRRLIPSSGSNY